MAPSDEPHAADRDTTDDPSTPAQVLAAVHAELARSDAGLVLVQLDDLVGQPDSVNLPGTTTERPNWSRLTNATLEQIVVDPAVHEALAPLREHRGRISSGSVDRLTHGVPRRCSGSACSTRSTSTFSTRGATFASTRSSVPTR